MSAEQTPSSGAGTAARRARRAARLANSTATPAETSVDAPHDPPADGPPAPRARPGRAHLDPDRQAAMEEERDFLLRSLEDLDAEHAVGDVDDVDYAALRDDYTARAAALIREIDLGVAARRAAAPPRSRARIGIVAALVALAAVVAGVALARSAGERESGQSLSGDVQQSTRDQLLLAQQQLGEGRFAAAIATYDEVLAVHPDDGEALAYRGWLLHLSASQAADAADRTLLEARALESLDAAVVAEPDYADARVFRAVVLRTLGRTADARADLDTVDPADVPPFMRQMVDGLRQSVAATPGTTAPG